MRISKWYLLVCAAVICGGTAATRANDNPEQAAARAALEAKMRVLNAHSASTNAPSSAPAATTPRARPGTAATTPPAQESTTPPTTKKTTTTTAPVAAPAQTARTASTAPSSDHGLFAPVPPPSGSVPGWSALAQPSTNSQKLSPFQGPFFSGASQNTNAFYPGKELGLKPITAPPLPISSTQEAQLQALLNKYDANIISPEQYQAERTKILAEHK